MAPHFNETIVDAPNALSARAAPLCHIITPVGMLGYGFNETETNDALAKAVGAHDAPVALILDSGSTDSGPSKLALGTTTCPRSSYVRDLRRLLRLGVKYQVPVLTSSAGGDGSDDHVELLTDIISELANEAEHASWKLKVLSIFSGISKDIVSQRLADGKVTGSGPAVPKLEQEVLNTTPRVVGQMGPEPFLQAMIANPDFNVVIGGRAYDPAPYVAFCAFHSRKHAPNGTLANMSSLELGAFTHMGKILECGGLCATPKSKGAAATVYQDGSFEMRPLDPHARCTPLSVAAHTLYEKTRPDILIGPGGYLDLTKSTYVQSADGVSVLVKGSSFQHVEAQGIPYTVKLEGARVAGYRTLMMGSFCDPILMPQIDTFLDRIKDELAQSNGDIEEHWDLTWHVYPGDKAVFVVGEVLAATQADATNLASTARVFCMHAAYPGQKATSGNFGMGIGGQLEVQVGECAEFSVYHLLELGPGEECLQSRDSPHGLFRLAAKIVGEGRQSHANIPTPNVVSSTPAVKKAAKPAAILKPASNTKAPPRTLIDVAKVVRSKNAGPYEITLDVMFDDQATYEVVKKADILNAAVISRMFGLQEDQIIWSGFFDAAMAFKATIPRQRNGQASCSGGYGENDVHGSQQYVPLAMLELPASLLDRLV
ncbi:hypothetical protein M409DRAFT_50799 [Zasmidium cellare ATCC 36951]|uniref:Caib baif family enzyme n=1 Tax=Zasmidium cellare ATCC 36951 TaxID=1080233 RepID=A0A6A6CW27_ZASCE|nr:uncharacterized protein M409DRAFT_50799 [Zasmidium cellare ATCC 36951]KAF2171344.1 hypothetical protein M409DRAFT_50799 [Zasmidium cellare ATCC 36951]